MFYSESKNRHKRWYHMLIMGHRKLWALGILAAFLLVVCLTVVVVYSVRAAAYDITLVGKSLHGSTIYDSQHRMVAMLSDHEETPVQWEELPQSLINAFIAREDAHFFDHDGVVYTAFLRSIMRNITSLRYKEGASTITMQLTRHIFELQGKTLDRKLLEIALTHRVENHYDKRTILCQYLSRIYFGQSCYGIREAANYYFGKQVRELSLGESAMLAGIVCAPSLYNPKRNPKMAHKVRQETLLRMLELGLITQEQFDQEDARPITLAAHSGGVPPPGSNSYPALWANAELESLPEVQEEQVQGMSVVSHLNLDIQRYLEQAVERTTKAVERPADVPQEWKEFDDSEALTKLFSTAKRPSWLTARPGASTGDKSPLQCCVLVVDSRMNRRGNILAVVSGRNAADRIDRWQGRIRPGRTFAPLVFCCACLPGGNAHHIVAHSAQVTGSRLGYTVVRSFFDTLALDTELPDQAHENDLYNALFPIRRIDLARLLFDLQNMGKGYPLKLISSVWSQGQHLIYTEEHADAPEYIRRESAVAVSHLPPFRYREGEPLVLHEMLPDEDGAWSMVFNDRGVAVFVWMGIEGAAENTLQMTPQLRDLISRASLLLAKEMHTISRRMLRAATSTPTP